MVLPFLYVKRGLENILSLFLSRFFNCVSYPEKDDKESIFLALFHLLCLLLYLLLPSITSTFLSSTSSPSFSSSSSTFLTHIILICLHHKFFLNFTNIFTCLLESHSFGNRQNKNICVNIYSPMHVHTILTLRERHALCFFSWFLMEYFDQMEGFSRKLFR